MMKTEPVCVRLEEELYELVQKQADVWHCSKSQAIRNMVRFYFEEGSLIPEVEGDLDAAFQKWLETDRGKDALRDAIRNILK